MGKRRSRVQRLEIANEKGRVRVSSNFGTKKKKIQNGVILVSYVLEPYSVILTP